jgi:hypothetical protein
MDYLRNKLNGNYYIARCNMMADQIISGKIDEKIDGTPKTKDLMVAEYALMKMQGINAMSAASSIKKDMAKNFKITDADLIALEDDYVNGKIQRDSYDESLDKNVGKAEFIASQSKN